MTNLSHISPITHPHPPSTEDALVLIDELLRRNDYVPRLIQAIHAISCPYEREAVARHLPKIWHKIEQKCDERTGYYDADGYWHLTWINIDCDMRQIIKQAIAEQQELEQSLPQPITTTPTPFTTKQTTTMSFIINNQPGGNVTNNHYDHCIIYQGIPQVQVQQRPVEDVSPACDTQSMLDEFSMLFTFGYRERRKSDFDNMLSLLQDTSYSDKDRARFALAIYQSDNLVPRTKPATFQAWYDTCSRTWGWNTEKTYEPRKLTPNEATRQIEMYL